MYKRIFLITFLLICVYFCLRHKMYSGDYELNSVKNHLGTRTPYRFKLSENDTRIHYQKCKDKKIWMIIRHGTRLPSPKDIIESNSLEELKYEVIQHHKLGKGILTNDQILKFEDWNNNLDVGHSKELTLEGEEEMVLLAERMMNRFPNIIPPIYDKSNFFFKYTATQRTQQSARHFTIGLFDKNAKDVVFEPATKIDPILRFYKHCDRWQMEVKKNASTYHEQRLFGISKDMNETLKNISKRLGLNYVLTLDQIALAYKICGYETSWNKLDDSPWCYLFEAEDAQRLEYYFDLRHYWMDGYGNELTYKLACSPIRNMFDTFSNNKGPNATFLFAHSGTLLKMLAHLHLFEPQTPLRGSQIDEARTWRASDIDCFATNLAFVLFRCEDGDYVLTLHQERIIKLSMCKNELCKLEDLKDYFDDSINNCDIDQLCSLD